MKTKRFTHSLTLLNALLLVTGLNAQNNRIMKTTSALNAPEGKVIHQSRLLYTEILINASPDSVWKVLTDFKTYKAWNPFITSLEGNPAVGEHIHVFLQPPGAKGMAFKPKVLVNEKAREFRWIGQFIIPRLFDGEHGFRLIDNGNGTTTFQQFERFRGLLVPFLKKMLNTNTRQGFEDMNKALKQRVEG